MSPSHLLSRYIIHLHFHRHSQPNRPHIAHIEIPEKYSANVQITCAHCHAHYRRHQDPSATLWGSPVSGLKTLHSCICDAIHVQVFQACCLFFVCEHLILNATGKLCPHIKLTLVVFGATKHPRRRADILKL